MFQRHGDVVKDGLVQKHRRPKRGPAPKVKRETGTCCRIRKIAKGSYEFLNFFFRVRREMHKYYVELAFGLVSRKHSKFVQVSSASYK